uniref:Secreted protein n=1 Tax=Bursaphelenchus xylophilus TaxID=6326 RepID=A0A1I7S4E1_BURXY
MMDWLCRCHLYMIMCRQAHARTLTRRVEFSLRKRPSFVPKRKKKHVKIEHNHKETLDSHSVQSLVEEAPLSQRIFEVVGFVSCAESKSPIKDFVPNVTDKRCHKTVLFFVLQLQLFLVLADAKMIQSGSKRNQT